MDQVDVKMLELLHENARIPVAEMSRQINMSQPALTERLRKLEDQGTISGYRVQLSPPKLGMHSSAFVLFRTNRCPDFIAFCEKSPVVIDLHRISGEYNFLFKAVTDTSESLAAFLDSCNEFGFSTVLIVLSTVLEDRSLTAQLKGISLEGVLK